VLHNLCEKPPDKKPLACSGSVSSALSRRIVKAVRLRDPVERAKLGRGDIASLRQIERGLRTLCTDADKDKRAINCEVSFMLSILTFVARIITGMIALSVVWFVLDKIHDRNTEIVVSTIGLLYVFTFLISRRLQYFGITVFSFFGRTTAYIDKVPYDQILRDEVGLQPFGRHLYLNVVFAALIELLCLFRLFSSLLGRGWGLLSDPIHRLTQTAQF
jgi:CTP-dependent riboflavin kinase